MKWKVHLVRVENLQVAKLQSQCWHSVKWEWEWQSRNRFFLSLETVELVWKSSPTCHKRRNHQQVVKWNIFQCWILEYFVATAHELFEIRKYKYCVPVNFKYRIYVKLKMIYQKVRVCLVKCFSSQNEFNLLPRHCSSVGRASIRSQSGATLLCSNHAAV